MKLTLGKWAFAGMLVVLVAFGSMLGTMIGQKYAVPNPDHRLPLVLRADSASGGKSMSMATGIVDRRNLLEGLFVLDHLSGLLQCWVVNPRNGQMAGIFSANVNTDLDLAKGGDADYVMTTGSIEVESRQNNFLPAGCICYVGDGNTGKVVGYSLFYDRQRVLKNGMQAGELLVVARGLARESGLQRDR